MPKLLEGLPGAVLAATTLSFLLGYSFDTGFFTVIGTEYIGLFSVYDFASSMLQEPVRIYAFAGASLVICAVAVMPVLVNLGLVHLILQRRIVVAVLVILAVVIVAMIESRLFDLSTVVGSNRWWSDSSNLAEYRTDGYVAAICAVGFGISSALMAFEHSRILAQWALILSVAIGLSVISHDAGVVAGANAMRSAKANYLLTDDGGHVTRAILLRLISEGAIYLDEKDRKTHFVRLERIRSIDEIEMPSGIIR